MEVEAQDVAQFRKMEEHPRCALLPSPDILGTAALEGKDVTNTLGDNAAVLNWMTNCGLLNTRHFEESQMAKTKIKDWVRQNKKLSKKRYEALVNFAFNNAFVPILNTANSDCEELVFWYYAGHGLGKTNIEELRKGKWNKAIPSAIPRLDKIRYEKDYRLAVNFMPEASTRTVKGGELCLHEIGFCDLNGVLEAWITALRSKSINIEADNVVKKNKHLVLILDSCYSGTFADDLNTLAARPGPWNENECTVTVQASCSANEPTFGGYFTPLFLYLNQNPGYLEKQCKEWEKMSEDIKETYSSLPFPSPVVATTRNWQGDNNLVTRKIECQNFSMQLFCNPGFFKYCFVTWGQELIDQSSRALTEEAAGCFLKQESFEVIDFKLKKLSGSASPTEFGNTPLGLFLVKDNNSPSGDAAVCVHLHFPLNNTAQVSRINLVHQVNHPLGVLFKESGQKFKVANTKSWEAEKLIKACHDEVEKYMSGLWADVKQWNKKSHELGVNAKFRLDKHSGNRSQGLNTYLKSLPDTHPPFTHQVPELST